ncbi:MAG: PASTA domain-containing protein [Pyrinomonadaceae bacterium]
MSIVSSGFSALGKLAAVALLAVVFLFGLVGVVFMSLQGTEVKVPDITGRDFQDSEKELALLGLKIKKRADRASTEKPNTVIEQLPKAGETVKTGQMILVVTSKQNADGDDVPSSLKKTDEDDADKIEEMITDKPKKPKANTNTNRKKADTTRDVTGDNSGTNSNSNSNSSDSNSNKKDPGSNNNSTDKPNRNTVPLVVKPNSSTKPGDPRPKPIKPQ